MDIGMQKIQFDFVFNCFDLPALTISGQKYLSLTICVLGSGEEEF